MNKNYALYKIDTGVILQNCSMPEGSDPNMWVQDPLIHGILEIDEGVSTNTHYMSGDPLVLTARTAMPSILDKSTIMADEVDTAIISNIPTGAMVTISGPINSKTQVDDGQVELTTDIEGTYTISIRAKQYLKVQYEVIAE